LLEQGNDIVLCFVGSAGGAGLIFEQKHPVGHFFV
jgi:hypothetical protein